MKHLLRCSFIVLAFAITGVQSLYSQTWTWLGGSQYIGDAGAYGTLGTGATTNIPSARNRPGYDFDGTYFWMFGGEGNGGYRNDLWKYNPSSGQWTWVSGGNTASQWPAYGTKGVASSTNVPGARISGNLINDGSGNLWLFGGYGIDAVGTTGYLNDLWKYNISSGQWTWVSGVNVANGSALYGVMGVGSSTNNPGARHSASAWSDGSGNLWMYGGYGYDIAYSGGYLGDLWKFNISTSAWTWMSGSSLVNNTAIYGIQNVASAANMPSARLGSGCWKDASNNLWLFQGEGASAYGNGILTDTWKYNITTGMWTWAAGNGSIYIGSGVDVYGVPSPTNYPGSRSFACPIKDASTSVYLIGGYNGGYYNDLWKYDYSSGNSKLVRYGQTTKPVFGTQGTANILNEPGALFGAAGFRDGSGNYYVFGGYGTDYSGSSGYMNAFWKMTEATAGPVANYNFNQSANVCSGTRLVGIDQTTGSPTAWTYQIDGTTYSHQQNPIFQSYPNYTIAPGTHTIVEYAANSYSYSSQSRTITVSSSTVPNVQVIPYGTTTTNLGNGYTPNSDWYPWTTTFSDPLPTGAKITSVIFTLSAVDQGWGGTGAGLGCYLNADWLASPVLYHSLQSFTYTLYGPFTNYVYGGTNTFSMYFVGWSGWQAFMYGGSLVFTYETSTVTVCSGKTVTLTATGASTLTWSNGSANNAVITPTASGIYTVTGTEPSGCVNTSTESIIVNPTPTISVAGSTAMCAGNSLIETATVLGSNYTFSWSTGATTNSISVSPTISTTYFAVANNTVGSCLTVKPVKISINNMPTFRIARTDSNMCASTTVTLASSQSSNAIGVRLTGSSDYISAPHVAAYNFSTNVDFTIEGWVNTTTTQTAGIVSKGYSGSFIHLGMSGTKAVAELCSVSPATVGATEGLISSTSINDGNWHHLALVVNRTSGNIKLYVDGVAEASITNSVATGDFSGNTSQVNIGVDWSGTKYFAGKLDEIRWWGQAQSTSAIQTNSTVCSAGTESNLLLYYNFENGPYNSMLADLSVNDNHGTLNNITASSWVTGKANCSNAFTSYSWLPGGATTSSIVITPTTNVTYTLTAGGASGCSNVAVTTLTVRARPTIAATSGSLCTGQTFTIVPSGGVTHSITGNSFIVTPTVTTTYSVNGTNSLNCTALTPAVVTITVNPYPVLSLTGPSTLCIGGAVTESVSGASTYLWNTGSTSSFINVSPTVTTTYSVTGTSAAGCPTTTMLTVTAYTTPILSITSRTLCSGNSLTLSPSGALTYTYSSGSNVVSPTTNTSYTITGTSSDGCLALTPAVANITVYTTPTVSVNSGTICSGNSFTITPTGAWSYTFVNGQTVVSPTTTTTYSILGMSSNYCYAVNPGIGTVVVNPLPTMSVAGPTVVCNGAAITQTISGATNYLWSTGSTASVVTLSPTLNTIYSITGTNAATGCSNTVYRSIVVGNIPVISVNSGNICQGSVFTMTPTGASTYTFSNGSNTVIPTGNSSYSVTGTSAQGCVSSVAAIANVIVIPAPVISVNSGGVCAGSTFTIHPQGATTFTMTGGTATLSSGSYVVNPSTTQSYSFTGTNPMGCISIVPGVATVSVNPIPTISMSNGTMCIGSNYTLNPSGAQTYTAINSSMVVSPTINTTYSVIGTSSAGCQSSAPAVMTLSVINLPTITISNATICAGTVYTLNPGGATTYSYSSGTNTVMPNSNSTYYITGANSYGCLAASSAAANITVLQQPVVFVNSGSICSGSIFTITPTGASNYSLVTGTQTISGNSFTVNPTTNTTYSVYSSNVLGCMSAAAISNVQLYPVPTLSYSGNTSICPGDFAMVQVSGAINYTWSTGAVGNVLADSPPATTIYSLTAMSSQGCLSQHQFTLVVFPQSSITVNSGVICPTDTFVIVPTGAANYTITGGSYTVTPTVTTHYSVTATDLHGCTATPAVATVSVVNSVSVAVSGPTVLCFGQSATLTASGANNYSWNPGTPGASIVVTPTSNASYSVSAHTGACADSTVFSITVHGLPTVQATPSQATLCAGESMTLTSSGATTYSWSDGSSGKTLVATPTVNTSYTVTGIDNHQCSNQAVVALVVNNCTGIRESVATISTIELFPNPNNGSFVVVANKRCQMVIKDVSGRTIGELAVSEGSNTVDLGLVANGIYFAVFQQSGQILAQYKIVKQ